MFSASFSRKNEQNRLILCDFCIFGHAIHSQLQPLMNEENRHFWVFHRLEIMRTFAPR